MALNARVTGISTGEINQALITDKTLLQAWSMRGAPYIFPAGDALVFTLGLMPSTEEEIHAFIPGVEPALEKIGIFATKVIDLTRAAIWEILDGRFLTKDDLGIELARSVLPHLTATQRAAWESPSWYAAGQTLGESVARFALPILSLQGLCCHADRRKGRAYLARADQWLGSSPAGANLDQARAELVRRYLHCFGPSTPGHFGDWAGIAPSQAAQSWKLVETELLEIDDRGKRSWLHKQDLEYFRNPGDVVGIRFLPPHDPFITLRDRESLFPDKEKQRLIWRHAGNPGVLLVDGNLAGIWRQRRKRNRLYLTVDGFAPFSPADRSRIEAEAAMLGSINDSSSIQVDFGGS
jgi:hypothetical protein